MSLREYPISTPFKMTITMKLILTKLRLDIRLSKIGGYMICPFCDSKNVYLTVRKNSVQQKCYDCKTTGAVNEIYNRTIEKNSKKQKIPEFYLPFGIDSFLHHESKL